MKRLARWVIRFALPPAVLLVILVVAWHVFTVVGNIPPYVLPSPARVGHQLQAHGSELVLATWNTALAALCGFGISLAVGLAVGIVFSQSRVVQRSAYPYAIFLQTMPIVAVAPLIIHWCGVGFQSVVLISCILSVFPIIASATDGLTAIEPNLLELFSLYNASRWQLLTKLRLPASVPRIVTGARISCGLSVIGAIVGEMFAGYQTDSPGLGYLITMSIKNLMIDYTLAALVFSTLLGVAIFGFVSLMGTTILWRWHSEGTH